MNTKPAFLSLKTRVTLAFAVAALAFASIACDDGSNKKIQTGISNTAIVTNPIDDAWSWAVCADPNTKMTNCH